MHRARSVFSILFAAALFAAAAACAPADGIQAPEIFYGQELCEECGMIISDAKFAAATIDTKGGARKFDDISGMLIYHMDHPTAQVRAYFVHDYKTQSWLRGETAFYVWSSRADSPMGDGIAAFADKTAAETRARQVGGQILKFDALRVNVHLTLHTQH